MFHLLLLIIIEATFDNKLKLKREAQQVQTDSKWLKFSFVRVFYCFFFAFFGGIFCQQSKDISTLVAWLHSALVKVNRLLLVDGVLSEGFYVGLAVGMVQDLGLASRLRKLVMLVSMKSCTRNYISQFTLGCISTNGSSADTSPPRAPRNSLTLTAYDTMIPKASRWSG